jgi:hypothetical protein
MMKVLVVDDEYDYCEMFKKVLCKRGHSVICTSDGRQALDVYYTTITETPKVYSENYITNWNQKNRSAQLLSLPLIWSP